MFCATDADAYGSVIYQTLQEATKARGARKIKIVHLGLHPWEAIEAGLEIEEVEGEQKAQGRLPTMCSNAMSSFLVKLRAVLLG